MISFPTSKINIGLKIIDKRPDGFHNIESVFYPIKLKDALEIVENETLELVVSGLNAGDNAENIVLKAYNSLKTYNLTNFKIHLHKAIPIQAGLGGGSSDAVCMLKLLNNNYNLQLSTYKLKKIAGNLGSDCSFFIKNKPAFVYGKGEQQQVLTNFLKGKFLVLVKPQEISISTKEAFENIVISNSEIDFRNIAKIEIAKWKNIFCNNFEPFAFEKYPELQEIKTFLYEKGAYYASMSGSGSAIYGIFKSNPNIKTYKNYFVWNEVLD